MKIINIFILKNNFLNKHFTKLISKTQPNREMMISRSYSISFYTTTMNSRKLTKLKLFFLLHWIDFKVQWPVNGSLPQLYENINMYFSY